MLELRHFLQTMELLVTVLEDEDDLGLTIIEKFEHYAKLADVAIVLLTPDDLLMDDVGSQEQRVARQNTLIELGWFMARLGRSRVILVVKERTILPSDLHGIVRAEYGLQLSEVTETIRRRLGGQGLI